MLCSDVNECATNNGGCEGTCNNTVGSYNCQCRGGLRLADNARNCVGQSHYNTASLSRRHLAVVVVFISELLDLVSS